ncbi:MAG: transporter substrate-binding protein [Paenibacillaceae bacterium]|jgi:MarR-like DNA-binding transcriptional regulator SgrR of sgrS sRNA|nr:transporter substrate-binding protein [Paenibacillaceae bacterium]
MHLIEYYHRLQKEWPAVQQAVPVTLGELAGLFFCSERNVKFILKKMAEHRWIEWKPGRGRGNRSELTLLVSSDGLAAEEARRLVKDGHIKTAMELINLTEIQDGVKEQFFEWLTSYFGYQEVGEKEKRLDTLRLPYTPVLTLDPAEILYSRDLHLVKQIFDTLVRYDSREGRIKPHLAHYWESNSNGTRWTFYLRKGVRFHHGRELTADDAAFTLERLKCAGSTASGWLAGPILQARATSPYVLQVELRSTNYMFLHYVSSAGASILPRDIYSREQKDNVRFPVGTGPFRVSKHDESVCVLDSFGDYFLERALLDRVELWMIPDEYYSSVQVQADMNLSSLICGEWEEPDEAKRGFKSITKLEQGCTLLSFNMRKDGPQQSRLFREAVGLLIDREALARETGNGDLYPARSFLPQEPLLMEDRGYDPEKAARLLRESGYSGEPLIIRMNEKHLSKGKWIARQLGLAGIRTELLTRSLHNEEDFRKVHEAHCYLGGAVADEDLEISLLEMYLINNMPLRIYFHEELQREIDQGIAAILEEPRESERPIRIRELETVLKRESYVLFLLHPISRTVYSPEVNGVSLNSLGLVDFKNLWFQPSIFPAP